MNISFGELIPITNNANEADAVRVIIPLNNLGIFNNRFKQPVIKPQAAPINIPKNVAKNGLIPIYMHAAVKEADKRKLPSAVISAKSRSLNVRKTPIAIKQQGNPLVKMLNKTFTKSIY